MMHGNGVHINKKNAQVTKGRWAAGNLQERLDLPK